MKNHKRILSFTLALGLAISFLLSGCGGTLASSPMPSSNRVDELIAGISAETAEGKGICGADLTWYYQDQFLVIRGSGKMSDYTGNMGEKTTTAPWFEKYAFDELIERFSANWVKQ